MSEIGVGAERIGYYKRQFTRYAGEGKQEVVRINEGTNIRKDRI